MSTFTSEKKEQRILPLDKIPMLYFLTLKGYHYMETYRLTKGINLSDDFDARLPL